MTYGYSDIALHCHGGVNIGGKVCTTIASHSTNLTTFSCEGGNDSILCGIHFHVCVNVNLPYYHVTESKYSNDELHRHWKAFDESDHRVSSMRLRCYGGAVGHS